jgi:hypothetical protein
LDKKPDRNQPVWAGSGSVSGLFFFFDLAVFSGKNRTEPNLLTPTQTTNIRVLDEYLYNYFFKFILLLLSSSSF